MVLKKRGREKKVREKMMREKKVCEKRGQGKKLDRKSAMGQWNRCHLGKCRYICLSAVIVGCLFLTGCGNIQNVRNDMKNIEERDYATILLVSDGAVEKQYHFTLGIATEKKVGEKSQVEEVSEWDCDHFEELAENYQRVKGKDLSLSHLKIILLSAEEMNSRITVSTKLFELLDKNEEIAKTCPVLGLSESDVFLEYLEEEKEPVGGYLERLIQAGEKLGEDIPWLKDYLKAIREGKAIDVYFLKKDAQGWTVGR